MQLLRVVHLGIILKISEDSAVGSSSHFDDGDWMVHLSSNSGNGPRGTSNRVHITEQKTVRPKNERNENGGLVEIQKKVAGQN